jgi:hypothetical protein
MNKLGIMGITLLSFFLYGQLCFADCYSCNPQCVPYAREKSGINTCKNGQTSPIEWYNCEKNKGDKPKDGCVMILEKQGGMPIGHAVYVKDSKKEDGGKYKLKISHSNFDCKCSQENATATYHKDTHKVKFKDGHWDNKEFNVLGFIYK